MLSVSVFPVASMIDEANNKGHATTDNKQASSGAINLYLGQFAEILYRVNGDVFFPGFGIGA